VDAEKFDKVVLDLLYDELDELTRASAIRHTEQSGRAKALYSELRATREVGTLPLLEPPDGLEERIMQAEERARRERPLRQRLGGLVSIAASYAMRPQLGMAAVLLLMVGSSLLLLRVKPGAPSSVQVTERGVPESEKDSVTVVPVAKEPPLAAEEPRAQPAAEAPRAARAHAEGPKGNGGGSRPSATQADKTPFAAAAPAPPESQPSPTDDLGASFTDDVGAPSGAEGATAAGAEKTADESPAPSGSSAGCDVDLPHYESILAAPGTHSTAEIDAARFAAAQCYQRLGRVDAARRQYRVLANNPTYADAARRALSILPESTGRVAESAAPSAAAKPAAKAAPAKSAP